MDFKWKIASDTFSKKEYQEQLIEELKDMVFDITKNISVSFKTSNILIISFNKKELKNEQIYILYSRIMMILEIYDFKSYIEVEQDEKIGINPKVL